MTEIQKNPRSVTGKVVSNKMDKTIVVLVERKIKHPKYGKYIKKSTKLHAHTELDIQIGDIVRIHEIKPMSKTKSWKVLEVVRNNK
jgi:small subunit ribosomal protein S17